MEPDVTAEKPTPLAQDIMDVAAETILVVEDNSDAREALGEFLAHWGCSVACAENGVAALDQIGTWRAPPALILLDLFMPVMDGNTFLLYARQDRRVKDVPIILMTGDLLADAPGVDAILTKPLRPERLLPEVRRFVKPIKISNSVSQ